MERRLTKNYTFVDYATQIYLLVVGVLILCFHNQTVRNWTTLVPAHVVGLVAIHWLINLSARRPENRFLDFLRHFYPVLLYTAFYCETGWLNRMFFREYLDPVVIRWDQALFGCQPGVVWMLRWPWRALSELLYLAYFSYYIMIGGVGLALFVRNRAQFFHYVSVISFVFYICYLVYIFLPIVGPEVFGGKVPGFVMPPELQALAPAEAYPPGIQEGIFCRFMAWIYRTFESPGSAWPSSHVAVALCTLYFSFRYLKKIRYVHLAVVVLLCISTVYCHYHYAVDVLGGVATAGLLLPLANRLYFKSAS